MYGPAAISHPLSFVLTKQISSTPPSYSPPICHTSSSRLHQIAQGIESGFDKQGGLDAVKLSAPIWTHFFLVWWNSISTWLALLDTAQTRIWLHLPIPTHIQLHTTKPMHTQWRCTLPFILGYVSTLGCQSNIHITTCFWTFNNNIFFYLPVCFSFFFTIFWYKESQYEFCQYCTAASLSFSFSFLLR